MDGHHLKAEAAGDHAEGGTHAATRQTFPGPSRSQCIACTPTDTVDEMLDWEQDEIDLEMNIL